MEASRPGVDVVLDTRGKLCPLPIIETQERVREMDAGRVIEVVSDDVTGAKAFGGFRDDPFFFDFEGYTDTLMTGTLAFNPARDFVAFKNTGAIVVEFDQAGLGSESISVWATTGRRGS